MTDPQIAPPGRWTQWREHRRAKRQDALERRFRTRTLAPHRNQPGVPVDGPHECIDSLGRVRHDLDDLPGQPRWQ